MYRLTRPKLLFFVSIVLIGIILVALVPKFFTATRSLSFSTLILGEAALSFIPIFAIYPKARPTQASLLAITYFLTTFIVYFTAYGVNHFFLQGSYGFLLKGTEVIVNTYALFIANACSLFALITSFKLLYDEDLAKTQDKKVVASQKTQKPKPKPHTEKQGKEKNFEDLLTKPFEFEAAKGPNIENLPEESSGKLFSPDPVKPKTAKSDFFEDGETSLAVIEKFEKKNQLVPSPPSNIKDDLQAIFEQYSSLNAIKKLTATKTEKVRSRGKSYSKQKGQEAINPEISIKIEGQDIHEATFRQISEEEKLKEIKEELIESLKEELKKELTEKEEREITEEEKESLNEVLASINKDLKESSSVFLNQRGSIIAENTNSSSVSFEGAGSSIAGLYNLINKEVNNTNQGSLIHLLLESDNGTLALGSIEDKILAVNTSGTGEAFSGQILRALLKVEESYS